ncbi:MAG: cache domain-containing protein, partial [Clostridiales bacterium]
MKKSIKTQMLFAITGSVLLLLLIMQVIVIKIVSQHQEEGSLSNIELKALGYAEEFNNLVSRKLELSKTLAGYMEENRSKDRQEIMNSFKNLLENDKEIIDNFLIYEPGAFDGMDGNFRNKMGHDSTGRFNFTYNRYSGSVQVAPVVDVDVSDYYTTPKKTLKPIISEPYLYQGILLSTISVPILRQGQFAGVAGVDLGLNDINKIISQVKVFESGYAFVISQAGLYIANKDNNLVGKSNFFDILKSNDQQSYEKVKNDISNGVKGSIKIFDKDLDKEVYIFYSPIKASNWYYAVVAPEDEMMAGVRQLKWILIVIGIAAVLLVAIIAYYISLKISKPIVILTEAADKISSGDLDVSLEVKSQDEIGRLTDAFKRLINAQKNKLNAVENIAEGSLERVDPVSD